MKNNKILFFILILISFFAYAEPAYKDTTGDVGSKSVEWQALKFQDAMESKIKRTLSPLVSEDQFIVEVQLKLDYQKAEEPTPKKKIITTKAKKVQFSNSAIPQDGDDFVVFNKLGLEAPLIGEEPIVSEVSEAELNQKATIELYERFNLFNYIEAININIVFDNSIKEDTRASIKMALDSLSFLTKNVVPQFNIQYMPLNGKIAKKLEDEAKKAEDDKKKEEKRLAEKNSEEKRLKDDVTSKEEILREKETEKNKQIDRFQNLDIMIGLIAAALILAIVGVYIANAGLRQEADVENKNTNDNKEEAKIEAKVEKVLPEDEEKIEVKEELINEDEEDMIDLSGNDSLTFKINQNLERFRTVLKHHHGETILMIKEWIKSPHEPQMVSALKALVEVLTDDELADIFKHLSLDERGTWKMILEGEMTRAEVAKAFVFIGNEIVKTMMLTSIIDDFEICDLLLTVTPEDAVSYCKKHPELGVVFANVLSSKTISEMFKLLPPDMAVNIIQKSAVFKKEEINSQLPLLKKILSESKMKKEKPPFLKRIIEILPTANVDIEQELYATLLVHMSVDECSQIALSTLPNKLIDKLPESFVGSIMENMQSEDRLMYLAILDDRSRNDIMEKLAPEGTKAREVIEMELENILTNEVLMRRISSKANKDSIKGSFIKNVRKMISSDLELKKEISPIVSDWLINVKNASSNQQKKAA